MQTTTDLQNYASDLHYTKLLLRLGEPDPRSTPQRPLKAMDEHTPMVISDPADIHLHADEDNKLLVSLTFSTPHLLQAPQRRAGLDCFNVCAPNMTPLADCGACGLRCTDHTQKELTKRPIPPATVGDIEGTKQELRVQIGGTFDHNVHARVTDVSLVTTDDADSVIIVDNAVLAATEFATRPSVVEKFPLGVQVRMEDCGGLHTARDYLTRKEMIPGAIGIAVKRADCDDHELNGEFVEVVKAPAKGESLVQVQVKPPAAVFAPAQWEFEMETQGAAANAPAGKVASIPVKCLANTGHVAEPVTLNDNGGGLLKANALKRRIQSNCSFHSNKAAKSDKIKPKFRGGNEAVLEWTHDVELISGLTDAAYAVAGQHLLLAKWIDREPDVCTWYMQT